MPLRHNFDSDNKIMQKNVLYVKTLAQWNIFPYHFPSQLLRETHFLSQTLLLQILFTKNQNKKACKGQKPDCAKDGMAPVILLQTQKRKLRIHYEYRYSKMKVTIDLLLLQNANFIPSKGKKKTLAHFLLGYGNVKLF